MNSPTIGLRVAALVFGLVSLAQLFRFAMRIEVLVGSHHLPLWPSAIAVVLAGSLSLWMCKLSKTAGK